MLKEKIDKNDNFSQEESQNASLVDATLNTLLCFLNWIPLGYIFETQMVHKLIHKVNKIANIYAQMFYV